MTLYAAQTRFARWGKALVQAALSLGLPMPLPRVDLTIAKTDPLFGWLQEMTGDAESPVFAILAGNPSTPGRRFIMLAFHDAEPVLVAKVGIDPEGRALVDREALFLKRVAHRLPHVSPLRGAKSTEAFSGLALEFIDGRSPAADDRAGLCRVLRSWLDETHPTPLEALESWKRLAARPSAQAVVKHLVGRTVAPALFHGDFTPWNVRAEKTSGRWTVIDWERGEAAGVPGWDWFHWVIHVSLLVQRGDAAAILAQLNATLQSADFRAYAQAAGITGLERALLAGYLVYLHDFIAPPEIQDKIACLRDAVMANAV
ncbi:phosphotransferase family enzyme [Chthoniobacter flavus]|nr:phosphotransferase family enzyme [Chthoniobacter flavus]